jgi:hypothetical protein
MEMVEMMNGRSVPKACVDALDEFEQIWPGATWPTARMAIADRVLEAADKAMDAYDANGDLVTKRGQKFRRIAWQIQGGEQDGMFFEVADDVELLPHGAFVPVYIEVGE